MCHQIGLARKDESVIDIDVSLTFSNDPCDFRFAPEISDLLSLIDQFQAILFIHARAVGIDDRSALLIESHIEFNVQFRCLNDIDYFSDALLV